MPRWRCRTSPSGGDTAGGPEKRPKATIYPPQLAILNVAGGDVPAETALRVSQILTESYMEMIQGQCLDLDFESRTDITAGEYLQMIAYKTGALIRSGVEIGALLATETTPTAPSSTIGSVIKSEPE